MRDMLFMERNKCVLRARTICFPFLDRNNSNIISKCIFTDRVVKCKIIFSEPAIKMGVDTWGVKIDTWEEIIFEVWL